MISRLRKRARIEFLKTFGDRTPSEWTSYSRLLIKPEEGNWVLDSIAQEMHTLMNDLNVPLIEEKYRFKLQNQCLFYTSKYEALSKRKKSTNRIGFPYYHGDPSRDNAFKYLIDAIKNNHSNIHRVQVSQSQIENLVLSTGIDSSKVFRIPISIDLEKFPLLRSNDRKKIRCRLGIPDSAILIGSFQKDGNGFKNGDSPKLIKGPDIFLKSMKIISQKYEEVQCLLTGPARGYVKKGLEDLGITYHHFELTDYSDISDFYRALDLYLVASREEGGPRAVLESMASGIPLVSTRVGQAMDLIEHSVNGWLVDVEDFEALAEHASYVIENSAHLNKVITAGRKTAIDNCYGAQKQLWKNFIQGFVEG